MNQPPDPYQQNPQPGANTPNNVPPFGVGTPYEQPSAVPYPPDYNQPGNYPPLGYPPQPGQWPGYPPQPRVPQQRKTGWIIGGICAAVVIIIIAAILIPQITNGFHSGSSSGWLNTEQLGNSTYRYTYIHWTNQGGQLNGSWDEYISYYSSGRLQSIPLDGTYNSQDQTVTLNIHTSGETSIIRGNIVGNTMTLHEPSGTSTVDRIFHSATQQDFDNAKQGILTPTPSY